MHFTLDGYPSLEKYRIIHSNPTKINLVAHASNQKTKNQIWCLSIIFKKKNYVLLSIMQCDLNPGINPTMEVAINRSQGPPQTLSAIVTL